MYFSKKNRKTKTAKEEKQREQFFRTAVTLINQGKHALVFEEAGKLLLESPNDAEMWNLLGKAAQFAHSKDDAAMAFRKATEIDPEYAAAWRNLGSMCMLRNDMSGALHAYRKSLALKPDPVVHSNVLFILQKVEKDPELLFKAHLEYGQRYGGKKHRPFRNNCEKDRKLRIGYVSGDLREHSVAFFIEPILAHHNHEQFEIHAFSNSTEDEVSIRLQNYVDQWHNIFNDSDEKVYRLIRDLEIDVLVDLSGHTNLNRLPVFGMRAAPVQVTWFGYMATTGLREMDYRLTDGHMTKPEMQQYYTEQLYALEALVVWQPSSLAPEISPPPCLENGHVTFGSFNNLAKITPQVWDTWVKLMAAVPDAILVIVSEGASDAATQQSIRQTFSAAGAQERLVFVEKQPLEKFLGLFGFVDIALDPFPYNGGTTSMHTLWAGVPVVTLVGSSEIERAGEGILHNTGLSAELVAHSPEEYVQIAAELARAPQKLAAWRAPMRDNLRASSLMAFETRARELENAYKDMFERYCRQRGDSQ